jgi:2-C-methyl-D-erythritol 2,4-cyclodiphosphate synthase
MFKAGIGYDVHPLVEGRPLILGGVEIPLEKGLLGHSDADVLVHALMDALLGAAGLGDIGSHFPDSDPAYKGASSIKLLGVVSSRLRREGYELVNADLVLLAQRPRIAPYIPAMKRNLAHCLGVPEERINIKATTTERLGFIGREEGMAAQAVVMIRVVQS